MKIQAEVSVYPLRTEELSGSIDAFCRSLTDDGLELVFGPMSTRVSGESEEVFDAIKRAFDKIARHYEVVLNVKLSNACPVEPRDRES